MRWKMRGMVMVEVVLALALGTPALAQRMFLDTDGDGQASAADALSRGAPQSIAVWVETNARADAAPCAAKSVGDELLTINSYEFILRAEGGQVKWGKFTNHQPSMSVRMGPYSNESDYYVGQMGMEKLPAGRYKLGTLEVTVVSGNPTLTFVDRSPVWQGALTSFGSQYAGSGGDNTLKLADPNPEGGAPASAGDWGTAVGLRTSGGSKAGGLEAPDSRTPQFETRITRDATQGGLQLSVTTTRSGSLRVRLYDVSGRLVRVITDQASIDQGEHVFPIDLRSAKGVRLPTAVYYFRVESPEGIRTGKVAVVR